MAGLLACGTVVKIMLFITVFFVLSTIFQHPFPSVLDALGIDDVPRDDSDLRIGNVPLDGEESSWTEPVGITTVKNVAVADKKILKFVARIIELEKSLVSASHLSLSNQQMCQLKQMMSHLKLVKTLFERSVFLTKLADLASHRTDSSPWIAWDQLEPATKEIEESIKTLHQRDDPDPPIYICFARASIIAVSFVLISIGCLFLGHKVVRWVRRR